MEWRCEHVWLNDHVTLLLEKKRGKWGHSLSTMGHSQTYPQMLPVWTVFSICHSHREVVGKSNVSDSQQWWINTGQDSHIMSGRLMSERNCWGSSQESEWASLEPNIAPPSPFSFQLLILVFWQIILFYELLRYRVQHSGVSNTSLGISYHIFSNIKVIFITHYYFSCS